MPRDKIIVSDKVYVPSHYIDQDIFQKRYIRSFFSRGCTGCEYKHDRPCNACVGCENYGGTFKLGVQKIIGNVEYNGIPMGDRDAAPDVFDFDYGDFRVVDKRVSNRFDYKIKIDLGEDRDWFDYQLETVNSMKKAKYGIFVLPPRSGKSLTSLKLCIELGQKTLLMADQYDFLNQFIGDIEESTNLPELQEASGKKLYGFIKKPEDLKHIQIGIVTYQSLIREGKGTRLLKAVNKTFGTLLIDEVQATNAPEYSRMLNKLRMRYRFGCTGTEKRKDKKEILMNMIIGGVKSKIMRAQMQAKLLIIDTKVKNKSSYRGKVGYVFMGKMLAKHKKRNELLLEWVLKDLEAGHSIVIPLHFKEHVEEMVKKINDAVGYEVAAEFVGGGSKKNKLRRDWVKEQASKRHIRVVVGIRSLLQRGINIKPWSCLYYVMPMNNEHNWKQESSRILTPDPNKRPPVIRFFVDSGCKATLSYFKQTWEHSLSFNHKPTETALERYREIMRGMGQSIEDYEPEAETETSKVKMPVGGLFGSMLNNKVKK